MTDAPAPSPGEQYEEAAALSQGGEWGGKKSQEWGGETWREDENVCCVQWVPPTVRPPCIIIITTGVQEINPQRQGSQPTGDVKDPGEPLTAAYPFEQALVRSKVRPMHRAAEKRSMCS